MGVGLVKVSKALIRLTMGHSRYPFWCLCQKLSLPFFTVINLLAHKSPEWSSLVPGPEAKSSFSAITNLASFTVSYHFCLQSLPSIRVFFQWVSPLHQVAQSIEASASALVLQVNTQDWFPLGLTGLISLQSKGLSRVFSSTTIWKHECFDTQSSLWSNSHIRTWLLEKL